MSDIGPFPGYFLDDKSTTLAPDQLVSTIRWQTEPTHLRIVRMLSPVQSNCDARHHCKRAVRCCLVNGTHTTGLRAYSTPPLKRLATVFREICFPEAARN
ncbi:hypothetical protein TNCV_166391 [Trichonephila clavipes]|nr:hypothetical protein TNCV_166391 [Trichonephila clavipes]